MPDPQKQAAESMVRAQRIDAICDQAEAAWRAGKRLPLEELIAGVEGAAQTTLFGELLALEVYYRRQLKEAITPDEYRQRFPQIPAKAIDQAFAANATARVSQTAARHSQSSLSLRLGETLPFVPGQGSQATGVKLPMSFGRYELLKELGRGAMGVVYLAQDTQLQRKVALKVPQLGGPGQEEMIERFYREARAAAALRHPHICPVFDVGKIDGQHFISMAFVEGHPLNKFITAATPQKSRAAAILIRKIATGLQEAHSHGIVHRDLKPGNIMVDARGEPTVMDFGLARDFSQKDATRVTQTGMLVGTPAYMSPEQIEGDQTQIGPATDIWSLGVILYELLTAQLPFPGATIYKVINNIQYLEPKPLGEVRPDVLPELAAICHKMLSKKITERYGSMTEVAAALIRIAKEPSIKPPPLPSPAPSTSIAETVILKNVRTAVVPRAKSPVEQVIATVKSWPHWRIIVGGSAVVCLLLVAVVAWSLTGGDSPPEKTTAAAPATNVPPPKAQTPVVPSPQVQPKVEPKPPEPPPQLAPPQQQPAGPVENKTPSPPATTNEPLATERRLFNGKDLTGWVQQPAVTAKDNAKVNWVVDADSGALRAQGLDMIDLASTDKFQDFHLRCDWRGSPGWETKTGYTPGIMVHCDGTHNGQPRGIEMDFNATGDGQVKGTGCFLAFDTPLKNHTGIGIAYLSHVAYGRLKTPKLKAWPAWNQIEIRCLRDRITVWINEDIVNEGWGAPRKPGNIVLRDQMCANEYRNIFLVALQPSTEPDPAEPPPPVAESRVIFNQQKLSGHLGAVGAVAITADAQFGFSAGGSPNGDCKVRKWNLADGKELFVFDRHVTLVDAVACDALGRRVLTGSQDQTVRLIDGNIGTEQAVFRHTATVNMVAVSPDGRWGASTSYDRTVRLWDLAQKTPHGILFGSQAITTHIAISPDSRLVAFGTLDAELVIAELESRRVLQRIITPTTGTGGFSPDATQFASCHPHGLVLIWDVETGKLKQRLRLGGLATTVQFLADGEHLLVSGSDRSLYYINTLTGQGNSGQRLATASRIRRIAIAQDKPQLLINGDDPSSPGPLLETWQMQLPQASELTTSYLIPAPPPAANEREVVEWILKVGGRLYLPGSTKPLANVSELPAGLWQLDKAILERCPLFAGEYRCLLMLNPNKLELGFTQLTDHDLQTIEPLLPRLGNLKMGHSHVTDAGLGLLAENRNLKQLDVEGTQVTAAGLAKVLTNNSLQLMALDSRQLTAEVGQALPRGPRANVIVIVSFADAPTQLAHLRGAEPNSIYLYGDRTTGVSPPCPDLTSLRDATTFNSLRLQSYTFTPQQILQVAALRQLRTLSFYRCDLPAGAVRQLETALPQCKITVNN